MNNWIRPRLKTAAVFAAGLAIASLLSACGPTNPDLRPEDSKLRDGITLLIKNIESNYPKLQNWDAKAVNAQIQRKLPVGLSTPAGWKLTWPNAIAGELAYVYVPWSLTATYPNHFSADNATYTAGSPVPSSIIRDLTAQQFGKDEYFAAIVDVRYSNLDKHWIIFTSVPYLPITDNAYGWANATQNGWKIQDFGTALVGCGKVPDQVQGEFGFTCPK